MHFRSFFTGGSLGLLIVILIHLVQYTEAISPISDKLNDELVDAVTELQRKLSHYENEMNRMRTEMDRLIKKDNDAIVNPPTLVNTKSLLPRSCHEALVIDQTMLSGNYYIDPDGTNIGDDPIYVYCNASTGATLVGHDSENKIDVEQCADPGCYSRRVNYEGGATLKQLAALIDVSTNCQQEIIYECFLAPLEYDGVEQSWWEDRDGVARYFWDGVNSNNNKHICKCGISGDCYDKATKCNCDYMGAARGTDQGMLTDRSLLPVTNLNFGGITPGGTGRHQLGKLECSGRTQVLRKPTSCHDLYLIGHQFSGYYLVQDVTGDNWLTVYCNFDFAPEDTNYQTVMGYNDIKLNPLNTHKTFPTSCQEVFLSGNQLNGFYLINKGGGQSITLVTTFCDFTKPQFDQENRIIYGSQSQTDIGENDVKSIIGGVYFSVRNGVNGGPRLPMRFPTVEFNNGNCWDSGRSSFVAPVDGVYFFSGEATAMITVGLSEQLDIRIVHQNSLIDVRTHEKALGECRAHVGGRLGSNIAFASCSVATTLNLKKGNVVSLRASQGYIAKSADERTAALVPSRAEFTGYLLQEALKN